MKYTSFKMARGDSPVRFRMVISVLPLLVTLMSMVVEICFCLDCVSPSGKSVDWFIMYKVPNLPPRTTGEEFYYLDSRIPALSFIDTNIQEEKRNPLFKTLLQIYVGKPQVYAMYNDQPPPDYKSANTTLTNKTSPQWKTNGDAHMKGAYAFDEKDGFWLISSVPEFPAPRKENYSYIEGQLKFAQSILCVTLDKKYLAEMQKVFRLTKPNFYDGNEPLTKKKERKRSSMSETSTIVPFISKGKQKFILFAKSADFGKDLYDSLVAVKLEDNLYVETYHPNLPSNCSTPYKVYNVKEVQFVIEDYRFNSTMDHAKWAVGKSKPWTCIGDINRSISQFYRGGGTMCLYHKDVSNQFRELVKVSAKCNEEDLFTDISYSRSSG